MSQATPMALPVPYVPVRVPRCASFAQWFTNAPHRCRTSQCRRTFVPLLVFIWNDLAYSEFDSVELASFKSRANAFLLALATLSLLFSTVFPFLFFLSCGAGVFGLIGCLSLSPSLELPISFNNNNK